MLSSKDIGSYLSNHQYIKNRIAAEFLEKQLYTGSYKKNVHNKPFQVTLDISATMAIRLRYEEETSLFKNIYLKNCPDMTIFY